MTMTTTSDVCQTCNQPHPWTDGTTPRHPFNNGSLAGSGVLTPPKTDRVVQPRLSPWPFDPVLRQALIDKNVLTPDDLRRAEEHIRTVTQAVTGGDQNGGAESSR